MNLVIIGGGCYGCYHTRQLLKAQRRGRIAVERFIVVDRNPVCRALTEFAANALVEVMRSDWSAFLLDYLRDCPPETDDHLVPAPFAPHLLCDWLATALARDLAGWRIEREVCDLSFGLPYEASDATGNRFISAAGWICPATCIEPARCPAIHAERTWELGEIVREGAERMDPQLLGVELFTCRHFAFGVGTIPVRRLLEARSTLVRRAKEADALTAPGGRVLVGTVSACHGVLGQLALHAPSRSVAITGR